MLLYTVKTWDGNAINNSSHRAYGLNFNMPSSAKMDMVEMLEGDPLDSGAWTGNERSLALYVESIGANKRTLDETLKRWFERGNAGYLVASSAIDGQDYQVYGRVQSFAPNGAGWTAIIVSGHSSWRRVAAENATGWTANAGNLSQVVNVSGALKTRLVASITATAVPSSGYRYRELYILPAVAGVDYDLRPWCITINHAAMVTAGTARADGNDLRVHINGVETRRYLDALNGAATKVWFNAPIGAGAAITLRVAVASSGAVGELQFHGSATNKEELEKLPSGEFVLVNGDELFLCKDVNRKLYKCTVVTRAYMGTAMAVHAAGQTFSLVPAMIELVHGYAAATDPAADDVNYNDEKPMFKLSSTNSQWDYDSSSGFYDPEHPQRLGQWKPRIKRVGNVSNSYAVSQNAESGNPAMGLLMASYLANGAWKNETATLRWGFTSPGGLSSILASGSKMRNSARFPSRAAVQKSKTGDVWQQIQNETSPASIINWTAFTISEISIGGTAYKTVSFVLDGSLASGGAEIVVYYEILSVTVKFPSTSLPSGTLMTQAASYPVQMTLRNQTNGQSARITLPATLNRVLLIDGENFRASYDGGSAEHLVQPDSDERETYIELEPGANTLAIEADVVGTLAIANSWYPRRP